MSISLLYNLGKTLLSQIFKIDSEKGWEVFIELWEEFELHEVIWNRVRLIKKSAPVEWNPSLQISAKL